MRHFPTTCSDRRQLQTHQQPDLRYQHEGADQDTHDLHGQQAMDLGRQRAYTSIRALPIEEHVKKSRFYFVFLSNSV